MFPRNSRVQLPLEKVAVVDLETRNLNARFDPTVPVYCAVILVKEEGKKPYILKFLQVTAAIFKLQELSNQGFMIVAHNLKFDLAVLKWRGFIGSITPDVWSMGCTMVMSYQKDTSRRHHSLDALTGEKMNVARVFVDKGLLPSELVDLSDERLTQELWARDWTGNDEAIGVLVDYCVQDVKATWKLYQYLARWFNLEAPEMVIRLQNLEFPMIDVLVHMESFGCPVDYDAIAALHKKATETKESLESLILQTAGLMPKLKWKDDTFSPDEKTYTKGSYKNKHNLINVYSIDGIPKTAWSGHVPSDDDSLVYDHCELTPYNPSPATGHSFWLIQKLCPEALETLERTKTGKPKINKEILTDLADVLPPELPISKLAVIEKQLSMINGIIKHINYTDGRIHGNYNNVSTRTGRLATNNPNLQNMTRPGSTAIVNEVDYGVEIRSVFKAKPGYKILVADLDSIELVVLAWLLDAVEKDSAMKDTINEGKNIHTENANNWKLERFIAKTLIFTIVYGGQAETIQKRKIVKTKEEAQELIDKVNTSQPAIQETKEKVWSKLRKQGYINNVFNARGYYPEVNKSKWIALRGERQSFNWLIQSTARDVMHMLTIESFSVILSFGAKIVNLIHDELVVECPEEVAEDLKNALNKIWQMRFDILDGIKVNGDWNIGDTWYQAK